jgi:dsRNA-specific ribonuclease
MTETVLNIEDVVKVDNNLVYNPYNPINVEITLNDVQCILKSYGLPPIVHNIELYKRAFIHTSYLKPKTIKTEKGEFISTTSVILPRLNADNLELDAIANDNVQLMHDLNVEKEIYIEMFPKPSNCIALKTKSNERLEFLGDGVLELITKFYIYRRFPQEQPGFMTDKKIAIVKNETIGKIAYEMNLHKWLIISKHSEEKKIRTNLKRLGCLFESFLGALFLDFNKIEILDEEGWFQYQFAMGPGLQFAQIFIENIFQLHINWVELIQTDDNYKNILQIIIQKRYKITPSHFELDENNNILQTFCNNTSNSIISTKASNYIMGVFICIGQDPLTVDKTKYITADKINSFCELDTFISKNGGKILLFLGKGIHKIKKKAEQIASFNAIQLINTWTDK